MGIDSRLSLGRLTAALNVCLAVLAGAFVLSPQVVLSAPENGVDLGPPIAVEPKSDLVGRLSIHIVERDETLISIARDHDLGFLELVAANPEIDRWLPAVGTPVVLPTAHVLPNAAREGVIINLSEMRLYYFSKPGGSAVTYPIGIGRDGWETPLGTTRIVRKRENPTWVPPKSIRAERPELPNAIPPGPDNPLGAFALNLAWQNYVIHGTNRPAGVGRRVSSGCIRLYADDIRNLFMAVDLGTQVQVVDEPIKLGWRDGTLYIEAHVDQRGADRLEEDGSIPDIRLPNVRPIVLAAAGASAPRIDWRQVARTLRERRGVPIAIVRAEAPHG